MVGCFVLNWVIFGGWWVVLFFGGWWAVLFLLVLLGFCGLTLVVPVYTACAPRAPYAFINKVFFT